MISLKEYAERNNITYEAVRAQVNRYREQLDDHIIRDGRQQLLDDIAVAFLDERRKKNPVVVYQQSKDETIERLEQENKLLLAKLAAKSETVEQLLQYKLEAEESRRALEDAKAAQARRERELQDREAGFAQELETARQEASEEAQKAAEEKAARDFAKEKEILEGFIKDAKKEIQTLSDEKAAADKLHQEELDARDKKIQELENRSLWDYLTAPFRKKGKQDGTEN